METLVYDGNTLCKWTGGAYLLQNIVIHGGRI